ncbi:hypothetical protein AG1IA_01343 [Rhizoctonia solani AG-1 IA]|uniref:Uncharacterized protein n=1 Tax=Thanatephorus cucumeris (strain AG1-IA) TaxID=983506 RepID=L8X2P5_THACA|nr:hypothetical protein AG1IA_01343 [Rhizoctonia solani AG-1 IA]
MDRLALDTLLRRVGLGGAGAMCGEEGASMLCLYDGVGGSACVDATGELSIASFTGSNFGIASRLCSASGQPRGGHNTDRSPGSTFNPPWHPPLLAEWQLRRDLFGAHPRHVRLFGGDFGYP